VDGRKAFGINQRNRGQKGSLATLTTLKPSAAKHVHTAERGENVILMQEEGVAGSSKLAIKHPHKKGL